MISREILSKDLSSYEEKIKLCNEYVNLSLEIYSRTYCEYNDSYILCQKTVS